MKTPKDVRVLVACEYSGRVRDAFRARGFDAVSCDLLPTDVPGPHLCCDVLGVLNLGWDLLIGHPTCTYLTNSGVCWLHKDPTRMDKMHAAAEFFLRLWAAPVPFIALENPIMHKYAIEAIGGMKQSQVIQPWMFGHKEKKATCLWLKGLPKLVSITNLKRETDALPKNEQQRLHYLPPSKDRWKLRSTTFQGVADAMANQWGDYVLAQLNKSEENKSEVAT